MAKYRPFHETIITFLNRCSHDSVFVLLGLIRETKIPANHDAVISAVENCFNRFKLLPHLDYSLEELKTNLLEQKREAEEAKAKKGEQS